MNDQQQAAHGSPCFHAEETAHPRFKRYKRFGGRDLSVIVTANVGLE
jgi:hypothetical protein